MTKQTSRNDVQYTELLPPACAFTLCNARRSLCTTVSYCFRGCRETIHTRPQSACHCGSRALTSIFSGIREGFTHLPHTHLLLSPATKSNRSAPFAPGDVTGVDTKRNERGTRLKFGAPSIRLQQCELMA